MAPLDLCNPRSNIDLLDTYPYRSVNESGEHILERDDTRHNNKVDQYPTVHSSTLWLYIQGKRTSL
jgi:hypothetical protein